MSRYQDWLRGMIITQLRLVRFGQELASPNPRLSEDMAILNTSCGHVLASPNTTHGQDWASLNPSLVQDVQDLIHAMAKIWPLSIQVLAKTWQVLIPVLAKNWQFLIQVSSKSWQVLTLVLARIWHLQTQVSAGWKLSQNGRKQLEICAKQTPRVANLQFSMIPASFYKTRERGQKLMRKSCHIAKFLECKFFTRFFLQSWFWLENQLASVNQVLAKTSHPSRTYFKNSH